LAGGAAAHKVHQGTLHGRPKRLHEIFKTELPSELCLTLTWTSHFANNPVQRSDTLDLVIDKGGEYKLQARAAEAFRQLWEQLLQATCVAVVLCSLKLQ